MTKCEVFDPMEISRSD